MDRQARIMEVKAYNARTQVEKKYLNSYLETLELGDAEKIAEYEQFGSTVRQIIENKRDFEQGFHHYGFTEMSLNKHGWLNRPSFFDVEYVELSKTRQGMCDNSITVGRGPNGMWAYSVHCGNNNSGKMYCLNPLRTPYESKKEAFLAGLDEHVKFHSSVLKLEHKGFQLDKKIAEEILLAIEVKKNQINLSGSGQCVLVPKAPVQLSLF